MKLIINHHKVSLIASVFAAVSALLLLTSKAQDEPTKSKPPAEATEVGRYQFVRLSDTHAVLVDTMTGRCWEFGLAGDKYQWQESSPPFTKTK